jgi:uncharacterized membrane protein HdeD (DUF308 family)
LSIGVERSALAHQEGSMSIDLVAKELAPALGRNWWVLLLRGIVAIVFGVLAWLLPGIALVTLILMFGAFALADGVLGAWLAYAGRKQNEHWWVLLLWGLAGIAFGILSFVKPGITALVLVLYIGAWAAVTGVLEIVAAVRLRKEITGEWLLALGGVLSLVFGAWLLLQPEAGALALIWLIACYAVAFGVLLVLLAFKVRGFARA